jgi:hypothetical protein
VKGSDVLVTAEKVDLLVMLCPHSVCQMAWFQSAPGQAMRLLSDNLVGSYSRRDTSSFGTTMLKLRIVGRSSTTPGVFDFVVGEATSYPVWYHGNVVTSHELGVADTTDVRVDDVDGEG